MRLTPQDIGVGLMVVTCKCCGNVYKTHESCNALAYSLISNFGCHECTGLIKNEREPAITRKTK